MRLIEKVMVLGAVLGFLMVGRSVAANTQAEIGEFCSNRGYCILGVSGALSTCSADNKCICVEFAIAEPGERPLKCRLKATKLGDVCEKTSQCKPNLGQFSLCDGNACVCDMLQAVASKNGDHCLPIVNNLGGQCEEDPQCQEGVPSEHSKCVSGVCACADDAANEPGKNKCYKLATKLGGDCEIHQQCTMGTPGNYSLCSPSGTCECDTIVSFEKDDACLPFRTELGQSCMDQRQCREGTPGVYSECRVRPEDPRLPVCLCIPTAINEPGKHTCYEKKTHLGEPCTVHVECSGNMGGFAECRRPEYQCKCKTGAWGNFEGVPDTWCYPQDVHIGQACNDSAQCKGIPDTSSRCFRECYCLPKFIPSSEHDDCLPIINYIGGTCKETRQCQRGTPGLLSICTPNNTCECRPEAVFDGSNHTCYKTASLVGEPCVIHRQCFEKLGPGAICLSDECICTDKTVASLAGDKCLLLAGLGGECQQGEHQQCNLIVPNSICGLVSGQHRCRCNDEFTEFPVINPTNCIKMAAKVGDSCDVDDSQCKGVPRSICPAGVCICDNSTDVESSDGLSCVPRLDQLGATCEDSNQCSVDNSACLPASTTPPSKTCQCESEDFIRGDKDKNTCNPVRKTINEQCVEDNQCHNITSDRDPEMLVTCRDDICQCQVGREYYHSHCVRKDVGLGDSCKFHDECHLGENEHTVCAVGPGGTGTIKECRCHPTAAFYDEGTCWGYLKVGDKCTKDAECFKTIVSGNSRCNATSRTCECNPGYSADSSGYQCTNGGMKIDSSILAFILSFILLSFSK